MPKADAEAIAMKYLERVKIPNKRTISGQLSGGQQRGNRPFTLHGTAVDAL